MHLNINTIEYKVDFHYGYESVVCIISPSIIKEVFKGVSWCNEKDQFCKKTGRKIALKRALKAMGMSRDFRKQFYTALAEKGFKIA